MKSDSFYLCLIGFFFFFALVDSFFCFTVHQIVIREDDLDHNLRFQLFPQMNLSQLFLIKYSFFQCHILHPFTCHRHRRRRCRC